MKLFFQLPYKALGWRAELELIRRFENVCQRLGHQFYSSTSIRDAKETGADFIFVLHYETAKVSPHFTVALVWNPAAFLRRAGRHALVKTLTHDAHLYASESLRKYFSDMCVEKYRASDLGNFYPSAEKTNFAPIESFGLPTYIGALWQKGRHDELFSALNEANIIHGYGPSNGWSQFKNVYRGGFAMDGRSYQTIYRRTGIGLCLHSDEHLEEGIPAMRIFEVVASGCVAICDEHSFVKEHFGDTVFYINTKRTPREIAGQIKDVVETIRGDPRRSREMARAAHGIFNEKLCLDRLLSQSLEKLVPYQARRFASYAVPGPRPTVEILTRTTGWRPALLRRALRSLTRQTFGPVRSTLLVQSAAFDEFVTGELPLLRSEFPKLALECVAAPERETLGQIMAAALLRSDADFVGVLDDDDWYYPEHVQTLLEALAASPGAAVGISGGVVDWEWSLNSSVAVPVSSYARDSSELLSFEPFAGDRFNKGEMNLCFAMLLFRRSKIPADLGRMFNVNLGEDRVLLSMLSGRDPDFSVFTSRVSCAWTYRHLQQDNHIDMRFNSETPGLPRDLSYNALNLPYLECNKSEYNRHHSQALADKCEAALKLLHRRRWVPRLIRPLLYQGTFNLLAVSIIKELMSLGVLSKTSLEKVTDLGRLVDGTGNLFPLGRQRQFNQMIGQVLSSRLSESDLQASQHTINLTLARELDRLSRSF